MRQARWIPVCLVISLAAATASRTAHAGTGREQEAFADEAMARVKENASAVRSRLGTARSSRDAGQSQCLDAKLTQLEVVQRQAEDARATLRRASLREDMDAMAQASAALTRLDGRAKELRSEAEQCTAEPAVSAERDERKSVETDALESLEVTTAGSAAPSPAPTTSLLGAPATPPVATPPPSTPFAPTPAPSGSPYAADTAHEASMLAYSADFTLAVFQVDKSLASVEALARELGGYLAQRGDAQITVRVPRPRFDEAIARLERLGDITHRNVSAEDVTDEYVDLELRLKNARAMRDQLATLLRGAVVKDAVEIEKELAKVTEVIEQIEGRLKVMRDKVGYSSITVSFQANAPSPVRTTAILPFSWLDTMGLEPLLNVPKVSP
ncbi:MAG TPA: DUF4349 domain-containing protein [Polyangiaceae bacterium]|jgi:hypothetical protein